MDKKSTQVVEQPMVFSVSPSIMGGEPTNSFLTHAVTVIEASGKEGVVAVPTFMEPLLTPNDTKYVMFPIVHHDVWELYKRAVDSFWKVEDIDCSKDLADFETLNKDEQHFIKMVLAFFSSSDGIVNENLSMRFSNEIQAAEIRAFYSFQNFTETIHCVAGDTKLLTDKGYYCIADLVDKQVNVWNGDEFSEVIIQSTGEQAIYRVTLSNGMSLDCTSGHKWLIRVGNQKHLELCKMERIETIHVNIGDVVNRYSLPILDSLHDPNEFKNPYMHGFFCGDGTYCNGCANIYAMIYLYGEKKTLLPFFQYNSIQTKPDMLTFYVHEYINKPKYEVPINYSMETKLRWFEGYADADGCVSLNPSKDATCIQLVSMNHSFLRDVQLMLTTMGILTLMKLNHEACLRLLPKNDGSGDYAYYPTKNCYVLYIASKSVASLMELGFSPKRLKIMTCERIKNLSSDNTQLITVVSVEKVSEKEPTYCFSEPKKHMGVFNGILTGQSEMYSQLIDTYVKNPDEKTKLFEATRNYPSIQRKADWAKKWIMDNRSSFSTRLIAFAIVEGIFFSSSFAAIFWMKQRNVLPGLCLSNEYISRDESLHVDHAVLIYHKLIRKVSKKKFIEILKEAVEIEIDFVCNAVPVRLIGMNSDLMSDYVRFVADRLAVQLGYDKMYNVKNPLPFMELISVQSKTNFFERRVSDYSLSNKVMDEDVFSFGCKF